MRTSSKIWSYLMFRSNLCTYLSWLIWCIWMYMVLRNFDHFLFHHSSPYFTHGFQIELTSEAAIGRREVQPSAIWWDAPRVMKLSWLTQSPGLVLEEMNGKGSSGPVDVCVFVFVFFRNSSHETRNTMNTPTNPCTRVSEPKRILQRLGVWWLTEKEPGLIWSVFPSERVQGSTLYPAKNGRFKVIPGNHWSSTVIVL